MTAVLLFASVREAANARTTTSDGATVQEVADELSLRYGEMFAKLLPYCSFYIGEDKVQRDYKLQPGDELAILPPVSGG